MTIAKKLYWGFGAILGVILFLFIINTITVARQYATRAAVASCCGPIRLTTRMTASKEHRASSFWPAAG